MSFKLAKQKVKEVGKDPGFTYSKVKTDEKGWADMRKFLPLKYDLVFLKIYREGLEYFTPIVGWWTGNSWDAFKMRNHDEVFAWKRVNDSKYVLH